MRANHLETSYVLSYYIKTAFMGFITRNGNTKTFHSRFEIWYRNCMVMSTPAPEVVHILFCVGMSLYIVW